MAKRTSSVFTITESTQSPSSRKKIRLTDDSVTKDFIRWKIENLFVERGTDVIFALLLIQKFFCRLWYRFSKEN